MSDQLSFWGYNEDGRSANCGERLIYFIECGDYVKIGTTIRDVNDRITELECGNPAKMNLIGTIVVRDGSDDRKLHQRFAVFHHRGEWFKKTPELMKSINDLLYSTEQPQNLRTWPTLVQARIDASTWDTVGGFDQMLLCPACDQSARSYFGMGFFHIVPVETEKEFQRSFTCRGCHTKFSVKFSRAS